MLYIRKKSRASKDKDWVFEHNIHFGQRRQPLVPILRWIIVLRLQQRCKELRNDASSQLEAIDAVWCKLIEYCSQMPNRRFTNAGLISRPFLNLSFAICNQSTLMTRTGSCDCTLTVHVRFFYFFRKRSKRMRADDAKHRYKK